MFASMPQKVMNVDQFFNEGVYLDHTTTVILVVVLAVASAVACCLQLSVFSVFLRGVFTTSASSTTNTSNPSTSLLAQDVIQRDGNARAHVSSETPQAPVS